MFSAWQAALCQWRLCLRTMLTGEHAEEGAVRGLRQPEHPPGRCWCSTCASPVWGGGKNTGAGHAEEWDQPRSMRHLFIWSAFILNVCFWNSLLNMTFSKFNSHNIYSEFCANKFWLWAFGFLFQVNNLQICITAKTQPLHLFPLKTQVLFDRYKLGWGVASKELI